MNPGTESELALKKRVERAETTADVALDQPRDSLSFGASCDFSSFARERATGQRIDRRDHGGRSRS